LDIGEPIVDTIPNVVTEETAEPGEPGLGWMLSEEASRQIEAIADNRRKAMARAEAVLLD